MTVENSLSELLYQLETRLFQPEVRHSRKELTELLADEFVEFGGFGQVFDREQIIGSLTKESSIDISIDGFKVVKLASNVALVTYKATVTEDNNPPHHSLRSSIWRHEAGNWRMVFHQGTPFPRS